MVLMAITRPNKLKKYSSVNKTQALNDNPVLIVNGISVGSVEPLY